MSILSVGVEQPLSLDAGFISKSKEKRNENTSLTGTSFIVFLPATSSRSSINARKLIPGKLFWA